MIEQKRKKNKELVRIWTLENAWKTIKHEKSCTSGRIMYVPFLHHLSTEKVEISPEDNGGFLHFKAIARACGNGIIQKVGNRNYPMIYNSEFEK